MAARLTNSPHYAGQAFAVGTDASVPEWSTSRPPAICSCPWLIRTLDSEALPDSEPDDEALADLPPLLHASVYSRDPTTAGDSNEPPRQTSLHALPDTHLATSYLSGALHLPLPRDDATRTGGEL